MAQIDPIKHDNPLMEEKWKEIDRIAELAQPELDKIAPGLKLSIDKVAEISINLDKQINQNWLDNVVEGNVNLPSEGFEDPSKSATLDKLKQAAIKRMSDRNQELDQLVRARFLAEHFGYAVPDHKQAGAAADRVLSLLIADLSGHPDYSVSAELRGAISDMAKTWNTRLSSLWVNMAERVDGQLINKSDFQVVMLQLGLLSQVAPLPPEGWSWASETDKVAMVESLLAGQSRYGPIDIATLYTKLGKVIDDTYKRPLPAAIAAEVLRLVLGKLDNGIRKPIVDRYTEFSSSTASTLWEKLQSNLGYEPSGYKALDGSYADYFSKSAEALLKVLTTSYDANSPDMQKFTSMLDDVKSQLDSWKFLQKKEDSMNTVLVVDSNLKGSKLLDAMIACDIQAIQLSKSYSGTDASEFHSDFKERIRQIAENIVVDMESWNSGQPEFVRTAWSIEALTRGSVDKSVTTTDDLQKLNDEWLGEAFNYYNKETNYNTNFGKGQDLRTKALTDAYDAAKELNKTIEQLAKALTNKKDATKLFKNLASQANTLVENLHIAGSIRGFTYGKKSPFGSLAPSLAALLGKVIRTMGRSAVPTAYLK